MLFYPPRHIFQKPSHPYYANLQFPYEYPLVYRFQHPFGNEYLPKENLQLAIKKE